ncbi:hypothetical protein BU25DRAFT_192211 [Macroventuria anomochaeta]|uniref:Uncharacterized protein n=1 Tax=Macroventuria anomochaeta TaxID=301207 RepID=A0ACB6SC43_9PLEO|nr:uncharacterized protein BU25DRAFT_192211 [Macroventuria anomochaeta]KAF2631624.1 hypothetical protein BU25DRAFT_192211 [Macroventuria anomochaeta]
MANRPKHKPLTQEPRRDALAERKQHRESNTRIFSHTANSIFVPCQLTLQVLRVTASCRPNGPCNSLGRTDSGCDTSSPNLLCPRAAAFDRAAFVRRGMLPSVQKQRWILQRHQGAQDCKPNTCHASHAQRCIKGRSRARLHLTGLFESLPDITATWCKQWIHMCCIH